GPTDRGAGDAGTRGRAADAECVRAARAFDRLPGRHAAVPGIAGEDPMSEGGSFSMMDLFQEEVRAHGATLNEGLLALEGDPTNPQKIEPLMRAAHSIKGAARIVNIESAVKLAHVMEDAFVAAQEGRIRIRPVDVDVLLRGADLLGTLSQVGEADVAAWSSR